MAGIQKGDGVGSGGGGKDGFGEDIVDEILVRLPGKSIVRFESVCKGWYSKFHSTFFKDFYNKRRIVKSGVVHTIKLKDLYKMTPLLRNCRIRIKDKVSKQICNRRKIYSIGPLGDGIYCLTSVSSNIFYASEDITDCQIALCNPSIGHFKFLPPFPEQFGRQLARISSIGNCSIVSGFSTLASDYSVVAVINYGKTRCMSLRDCFLVFVYTLQRGEWEIIVDYIPGFKSEVPSSATSIFGKSDIMNILPAMEICSQTFCGGCWHWITINERNRSYMVLSFNFSRQSFNTIAEPNLVIHKHLRAFVVVLHDHLTLNYSRSDYVRFIGFEVWMMMDYGVEESWTRIFNIQLSDEVTCKLFSLYWIDYSVQEDVKDESGGDSIIIERLFLTNRRNGAKIISIDRHGGHEVSIFHHDFENDISFSTGGISTYKESLERM